MNDGEAMNPVMAGLVPAIHVLGCPTTWMPGTRPGMTDFIEVET
jgi:hypothetical protein